MMTDKKKDTKEISEELSQYGIEYVSDYNGDTSKITIRCMCCGYEWEKSYHNLIQKLRGHQKKTIYIACPNCREQRDEMLIEQRRRLNDKYWLSLIKRLNKWIKENTQKIEQKKRCANCGKLFVKKIKSKKYCSIRCRNRAEERRKSEIRDKRINQNEKDKGITLDKIYKKYEGVCYLCGGKCDYNDYKMNGNAFIVGNSYPSIEHIIPISKGGTHTYKNIKLAHMICNSHKSNKILQIN